MYINNRVTSVFACLLTVAFAGLAIEAPATQTSIPTVTNSPFAATSNAPTVPTADVVLAPGDEIQILVYDSNDLERTLRVGRDPINFPLIGDIGSLVGLSTSQVERLITTRLADGFLLRPAVTVTVTKFAPRTVAVLGSVRTAMRITIDPHTTISVLQALAEANGLLDDADRSKIMILRAGSTTSSTVETVPLTLINGALPTADIWLRYGDTVIVPRSDRAYVMGMVAHPGPIQIEGDTPMTVARAISVSGGFQRFARQSKVQLLRDGRTVTVDVGAILAGNGQDDLALKPGDVIYVPESIL